MYIGWPLVLLLINGLSCHWEHSLYVSTLSDGHTAVLRLADFTTCHKVLRAAHGVVERGSNSAGGSEPRKSEKEPGGKKPMLTPPAMFLFQRAHCPHCGISSTPLGRPHGIASCFYLLGSQAHFSWGGTCLLRCSPDFSGCNQLQNMDSPCPLKERAKGQALPKTMWNLPNILPCAAGPTCHLPLRTPVKVTWYHPGEALSAGLPAPLSKSSLILLGSLRKTFLWF